MHRSPPVDRQSFTFAVIVCKDPQHLFPLFRYPLHSFHPIFLFPLEVGAPFFSLLNFNFLGIHVSSLTPTMKARMALFWRGEHVLEKSLRLYTRKPKPTEHTFNSVSTCQAAAAMCLANVRTESNSRTTSCLWSNVGRHVVVCALKPEITLPPRSEKMDAQHSCPVFPIDVCDSGYVQVTEALQEGALLQHRQSKEQCRASMEGTNFRETDEQRCDVMIDHVCP